MFQSFQNSYLMGTCRAAGAFRLVFDRCAAVFPSARVAVNHSVLPLLLFHQVLNFAEAILISTGGRREK